MKSTTRTLTCLGQLWRPLTLSLMVAGIVACGSSSTEGELAPTITEPPATSEPPTSEQEPEKLLTGQMGLQIQGLPYRTASHSGVTDANGGFEYRDGETVTFFLGDTDLASVAGKASISPLDLAPEAELFTVDDDIRDAINGQDTSDYIRMFNIVRLLMTLDEDHDPANGVAISGDSRAAFTGVSLTTDQGPWAFANAASGVIGDLERIMMRGETAIAHLYRALEQPIMGYDGKYQYTVQADFSYDDGDGVAEYASKNSYDDIGNLIRTESLNRGVTGITVYSYNPGGYLAREEYDEEGDGVVDVIGTYHYDAAGNLIRNEWDGDGDETTANSVSTYAYDANGNRTRYEYDSDADKTTANRIYTYAYDANGNRTRYEYDGDDDGNANWIRTYTYDANGNRTRYEYDRDADETTANSISTYTYDEKGNLTRDQYDGDDDGNANRISTYTYDENGNQIRHEYDRDGDYTADAITTYAYDENGNQIYYEHDRDLDGNLDWIESSSWITSGMLHDSRGPV